MKSEIRKCKSCGRYTLSAICKNCGAETVCPVPPRYSPDDRLGEYRRRSIIEEYGENGKFNHL
ncbi:MAG: RNA-protein complex protein Nop10 [Thermoplasmata archaeon]|nr:RNA-protein complex protein Nop10 [Thermoplasmata archaeon]